MKQVAANCNFAQDRADSMSIVTEYNTVCAEECRWEDSKKAAAVN